MIRYLPFLLVLAVWIYAFIDCLNTPEQEIRKLPKVAWVIIILLFGQVLLGPIAWFWVGRPRSNAPYGATRPEERRWVAPDDNPDFLKSLRDGNRGPDGGADPNQDADRDRGSDQDRSQGDPRSQREDPAGGGPSDTAGRNRPARSGERPGADPLDDPALFEEWEADLRRREDNTRGGKDGDPGGPEDTPPRG